MAATLKFFEKTYSFEPFSAFKSFDSKKVSLVVWPKEKVKDLKSHKAFGVFGVGLESKLKPQPAKAFGPASQYSSVNLPFTEGGAVNLLLVNGKISTHELFEALRLAFKTKPQLVLCALEGAMGEKAFEGMASLFELVEWKGPEYGLRTKASNKEKADKDSSSTKIEICAKISSSKLKVIFEKFLQVAQGTNLVRTLAETPGNYLNPSSYRKEIEKFSKDNKLKFEFIDQKKLKALGAGSFLAVARSEENHDAGIAHLVYKAPRAKKKIALVGKGLCFDTGGYNIKTGDYMEGMHKDMTGSAVVLALMGLMAQLKLPIEVHGYMAIAENLISPTAFRPNDVVTALDGTTIEVNNTDAEGRMVLADTLALARREAPDLCIDFATLTGSCLRATDKKRAGVFSHTLKFSQKAMDLAENSGERLLSLPSGGDFWKGLKSEVADTRQIAPGPGADMSYAATFLSHFIGAETPWLHIDLSPHVHPGGLGLVGTDEQGFGVRAGLALIEGLT